MYSQFTKELVNNFCCILHTSNFDNSLENTLCEWVRNFFEEKNKSTKEYLEFIQNHEKKISFSSVIGFFYQYGIGCEVDKNKALEMYLLAIKQDDINNIIAKHYFIIKVSFQIKEFQRIGTLLNM